MAFKIKSLIKAKADAPPEEPTLWEPGSGDAVAGGEKEKTYLYNIPVHPKALPGPGVIWVIHSPEGGDGSTTVATNLAAVLAKDRPGKVVLIDLDGFGAVRSRMGLPTSQCLVNILDWQEVQEVGQMQRAMVQHSSGVQVIPGVLHHDHLQFVTPSFVLRILSILKERYEHIILDCSPVGQQNNTWAACLVADVILTVIKPDRTSLDLVKDNLSFLSRLGADDRFSLILNQAGLPGGIRTADLSNPGRSGLVIHHALPYSIHVQEANNKRELIALSRPKDEFADELRSLIKKLTSTEISLIKRLKPGGEEGIGY